MVDTLQIKGKLFIISGPSGVGKSTILKEILKDENLIFSISCTTRTKRQGEIDGKDYFFVTKNEFESKIKNQEFIEWANVHDNYYGTPKKWVEDVLSKGKDVLLDIDVQGALNLQKILTDAVFIFIMPPSIEELKKRIEARKTETEESLARRIKNAENEMAKSKFYDYVVKNDILEEAITQLFKIIEKERRI